MGAPVDKHDGPVSSPPTTTAVTAGDGAPIAAKPTLKTIAQISGLAVPTVSRALKDAPDIGKATRQRVQRIARDIGYVPNRAGVRLRTGKTNVISLVLSTDHDLMTHTARLVSSIAGGLRDTAYHLNVMPYFPDEDPMRPIRTIVERRLADAVIINHIKPEDERVAYLLDRRFAFATHGRTIWSDRHAYFDYDNEVFGAIAVAALRARGRRQLMMVAPPLDQAYAQHMIEGAGRAARNRGAGFEVLAGVTSVDPSDAIEDAVAARLASTPRIDGIVCGTPMAAMASVAAAERLGFQVGPDFDLIASQALPVLKRFRRAILAVPEDVVAAGEFLAKAAIAAVDRPAAAPMQHLDVPDASHIE